jgi:hypothetical protein
MAGSYCHIKMRRSREGEPVEICAECPYNEGFIGQVKLRIPAFGRRPPGNGERYWRFDLKYTDLVIEAAMANFNMVLYIDGMAKQLKPVPPEEPLE